MIILEEIKRTEFYGIYEKAWFTIQKAYESDEENVDSNKIRQNVFKIQHARAQLIQKNSQDNRIKVLDEKWHELWDRWHSIVPSAGRVSSNMKKYKQEINDVIRRLWDVLEQKKTVTTDEFRNDCTILVQYHLEGFQAVFKSGDGFGRYIYVPHMED